jgi:hypothetical protein
VQLNTSITAGTTNIGTNLSGTALTTASVDTTYFVVGNYRKVAGGNNDDEFQIWVNPTLGGTAPGGELGSTTITMTEGEIVNAARPLNTVRWRVVGDSSTTVSIDELRLGESFSDVAVVAIPEPGSLALILLGLTAAAFVAVCRRR